MATLSIRLNNELEEKLAKKARQYKTNQSEIAREAVADYLRRRERERFMAEIVEAAQHLKNDPKTLRLVEE